MKAFGLVSILRRPNSAIGKLLIALASLLVVCIAFVAGVGIYAAAQVWWPLLTLWWPRLLAGAAAVVALAAWWLWWRLPKRQVDRLSLEVSDAKARADVEDNFRKTIGQLLGGAAVLIGAGFAYLQFQQQQESTRLQIQAAHDLLISNQVAKGFELLGNKDNQIQQRLGGIYALEGVMNTSKEYYQPVLEALCAFIRDRTAETSEGGSDIRAALYVVGRRVLLGEAVPDLRDIRLPKADLSTVRLTKAILFGANLSGANLSGANLNGANLNGANLSGTFLRVADLSGTSLFGADLTKADLFEANLNQANLIKADLSGANLSGVALTKANLRYANLNQANLTKADLTKADLFGANLTQANLREARFLTQQQLDQALCGTDVKLDPGLTIKPCPPR